LKYVTLEAQVSKHDYQERDEKNDRSMEQQIYFGGISVYWDQ